MYASITLFENKEVDDFHQQAVFHHLLASRGRNEFPKLTDALILSFCTRTQGYCSEEVLHQVIQDNTDDGAFHWIMADYYLQQKDVEAAHAELNQFVSSNTMFNNFGRSVYAYHSALQSLGYNNTTLNMAIGVGFAANANILKFSRVSDFCNSPEQAALCQNIGGTLSRLATNEIQLRVGQSITSKVKTFLPQDSGEEIKLQTESIVVENHWLSLPHLLELDDDLANYYMQELARVGEIKAVSNTNEKIAKLIRDPAYDPCNQIR